MEMIGSRRNLVIAIVGVVALAICWYWGSPRWTMYEMRAAAAAQDSGRLAEYIDFPAVRESLKSEMAAKAAVELTKSKQDGTGGLEALGAMVAVGMADGIVDTLVTPEAMKAMFDAQSTDGVRTPGGLKIDQNAEISRDGWDQFRVHAPTNDGRSGDLIFTRHGFGWMMSGVQIPLGSS